MTQRKNTNSEKSLEIRCAELNAQSSERMRRLNNEIRWFKWTGYSSIGLYVLMALMVVYFS